MDGRGTIWDGGVVSDANTPGALDMENFGKARRSDCVCVAWFGVQYGRSVCRIDFCVSVWMVVFAATDVCEMLHW